MDDTESAGGADARDDRCQKKKSDGATLILVNQFCDEGVLLLRVFVFCAGFLLKCYSLVIPVRFPPLRCSTFY